ncbi:MAG TPA: peptidylprolyl isomerase [Terriglobales bacterium]|nr:peptidylprolyl isomerase [Terriglobales bacterium]
MKRIVFLPVVLLLISLPLTADTVLEEIVARVNSDIITRSDYQHSRDQLMSETKEKFGAEADTKFAEDEKNVLRDLIDQDLLVQKGKDLGITADTELIKRLDEIRKQMNLGSMEELEKAASQQGVSFEDFKQNLRNQIITQQVISKEVGAKMQITADEEQKFYDEHKSEIAQPEQVRLSEIMVSTSAAAATADEQKKPEEVLAASPEQLAAAQQRAQELLDSIRKGASFEDVAKRSSDGPTAAQGGDLGYFRRGMLAKELENIAFDKLKPGDTSDVIRTKQGFVILKVSQHEQAGLPPLKEIEPKIQDAIYVQKLQPALRAYLTKLREDAFIDIKAGFVDTAASPNETKPIYTAEASAPADHPKKKKKKLLIF